MSTHLSPAAILIASYRLSPAARGLPFLPPRGRGQQLNQERK